jgi:cell division protein FtsN
MAKDYAHHSRDKSKNWNARKKEAEKKPIPWRAILLFLLLSTGLVFSIVSLYRHKSNGAVVLDAKAITLAQKKPVVTTAVSQPATNSGGAASNDSPPPQKINFDFYTMLPQMKVSVAEPGKMLSGNADTPAAGEHYLLQLGTVTNGTEAKKFQENLRLEGFKTVINPFTRGETTWYRIQMGPYSDYQTAQNAQASLQEQQVNAIILHVKSK